MTASSDEVLFALTSAIPPPSQPSGVTGPLSHNIPEFPPDYLTLVRTYGSGYFDIDGGIFLEVLNPYGADYVETFDRRMNRIRSYKESEGDDYIPYNVYPDEPGLLLWGYGQDRKHFFWLTKGDSTEWPIMVMYDLEVFTRFDCSTLSFVRQLLCGEIECSFIGGVDTANNCVDPQTCEFVARVTPA